MSSIPAIEDLVWLFEAEAEIEFDDLGYPASAATFRTLRGSTLVEVTVEPHANSVGVSLSENGEDRLRLNLWGIVDRAEVDRSSRQEALAIFLSNDIPFRTLRVELKPTVHVTFESAFHPR